MDKSEKFSKLQEVKKMQEIKRFFTFCTIGLINTSVDFGIYMLMTKAFEFHYGISQAVSYSCGIINSFLLNNRLTFGDVEHTNTIPGRFVKFVAINLFSLAATVVFLHLYIDILHLNDMVSKIAVIIISQAINYLGYKMWVFKNEKNP
ncbi:MAG TPA: GtrA family protein [Clostridiaceae bacterium]|nr:GtrA family protein [Clostridiaceae bacterium]